MPDSPLPLTADERARRLLAEIDGPRCGGVVLDAPIRCSSPAGHDGPCTPETGTPWATVAALRDVLADLARVEGEREEARAEASAAVQDAAVGEAVIAALRGQPVSDFMGSFGPVAEAQNIGWTVALLRADNAALWTAVRDACAVLRVTDDSEDDWPKLPSAAAQLVEDRDTACAESARLTRLLARCRKIALDGREALATDQTALESVADLRAESARLTRELAEARDALNYLRRKLDEGDALREVADAAEGRATLALAGGGS